MNPFDFPQTLQGHSSDEKENQAEETPPAIENLGPKVPQNTANT